MIKTNKNIKINAIDIDIKEFAVHETGEYVAKRLKEAIEETLAKQNKNTETTSYFSTNNQGTTAAFLSSISTSTASIPSFGNNIKNAIQTASFSLSGITSLPNLNTITPNTNVEGNNTSSVENSNSFFTVTNGTISAFQKSSTGTDNNAIIEGVREKIDFISYQLGYSPNNQTLQEDKKYWQNILDQLEQGESYSEFLNKEGHERFTDFYTGYKLGAKLDIDYNLDWVDTKLKMINAIEKNLINQSQAESYWMYLLRKLRNSNIDIIQLFDDHEELFLILRDILDIPSLPGKLSISVKNKVYPKLFTDNIYANIGSSFIYDELRNLQITKVDGAYQILRVLDEVVISNVGEKKRKEDGTLPALLEGQWYAKDRIDNSVKPGSSFWKASIYNTKNEKAFLYKTIAQRHAYYKFADAYLKSLGIMNEWFDAASRVTTYNPFMLEVAVGGADKGTLSANWYLSSETSDFLRGGNEFLLEHNMLNLKKLIEGKGTMNLTFTDAKGKKQNCIGLTKKELDFKLVEFEQSLVQQYIKKYLEDNKATSAIEAYFEEKFTSTPKEDLEEIINEINDGFIGWANFGGEDTTETIIEKYFAKDGKLSFDFENYQDRVKLGQMMVEELYYRRYRDNLSVKLERIIKNPKNKDFVEKPTQAPFNPAKKGIPEKVIRFKDFYKEVQESYQRLVRTKDNFDTLIKENKEEAIQYVKEELEKIKEKGWKKIKKELKNYYRDIEEYLDDVVDSFSMEDGIINEAIENPEEILRILEEFVNPFSGGDTIIRRRPGTPEEVIRRLKEDVKKGKNNFEKTFDEGVQLYEQLEDIVKNPEKYYKEAIKKVDNKAKNALVKTAIAIYPNLMKVVEADNAEKEKIRLFETNYKATVAILLHEFATGISDEHQRRFNYNEHPFANKVLEGRMLKEIMKEAIDILERDRYDFETMPDVKEFSYQLTLEFSPDKNPRYWLESLDKHFDSNLPQFFMGGAVAYFYIKNGKLIGMIENKTGRKSLMLHIGNDYDLEKASDKQERPILTTVSQRVYFTFKLPKK